MENEDESVGDINIAVPSEGPSMKTGSFHKRTSVVWNDFERVLVDDVYKTKCRKYAKLYSCFSSRRTRYLKSIKKIIG